MNSPATPDHTRAWRTPISPELPLHRIGVGTLRSVTPRPEPAGEQAIWRSNQLAERWGVTSSYVHQLRGEDGPLRPPLPDGQLVGGGRGTMVWTGAQVAGFEAAHPDWVAGTEKRRVSRRGRRPRRDDGATTS